MNREYKGSLFVGNLFATPDAGSAAAGILPDCFNNKLYKNQHCNRHFLQRVDRVLPSVVVKYRL